MDKEEMLYRVYELFRNYLPEYDDEAKDAVRRWAVDELGLDSDDVDDMTGA